MGRRSDNLGIDFLSMFGMPPVEFIHLAASLDCPHVTMALQPIRGNPHEYPPWSLLEDRVLRREVHNASRDQNVAIAIGEGILLMPGADIVDSAAQLDALAEIGANHINVAPLEPNQPRCFDQLAIFAELVIEREMLPLVEFAPIMAISDLKTAVEAVRHSRCDRFQIVIDVLHVVRSDTSVDEIKGLAPDLIGYVQLCDGPLKATRDEYLHEATFERLPPGAGEFPLREFLDALPAGISYGVEVPMLSEAEAGVDPMESIKKCLDDTRRLLAN